MFCGSRVWFVAPGNPVAGSYVRSRNLVLRSVSGSIILITTFFRTGRSREKLSFIPREYDGEVDGEAEGVGCRAVGSWGRRRPCRSQRVRAQPFNVHFTPSRAQFQRSVFAGGAANKNSIGLAVIAKDFDCGSIYENAQL
jgi:hypothetical protein